MPRLGQKQAKLSGTQFKGFVDAICSAYDKYEQLEDMLKYQLDQSLPNLVDVHQPLPRIVHEVIKTAEQNGQTLELLLGARASKPTNPELLEFAQQFGLAPMVYEQGAGVIASNQPAEKSRLERIIIESSGLKDVEPWLQQLSILEAQVCRIEIPMGNKFVAGTGFLLGPNTVITNYHVIEIVHKRIVDSSKVILRFDYKQLKDGITVNAGTEYHLAANWLIDSSPPSAADMTGGEPAPDELDYALLNVDGAPGRDPVGGPSAKDPAAPPRGWVSAPVTPPEFVPEAAMFILQHPKGSPLKLALDTHAVLEAKFSGRRLRYRTNTEAGSSGSPCFDDNWNLVALHHMGDPEYNSQHAPMFNQGIPINTILALIKLRKLDGAIGG